MALVHGFLSFLFCHLSPLASPEAFCDEQTMQTHSSTEWLFEESWHFCRYSTENQFPIDPALFHAALPKRMLWSCWTAVPIGSGRGLRHLLGLSAEVKMQISCFVSSIRLRHTYSNYTSLHVLLILLHFSPGCCWIIIMQTKANLKSAVNK